MTERKAGWKLQEIDRRKVRWLIDWRRRIKIDLRYGHEYPFNPDVETML